MSFFQYFPKHIADLLIRKGFDETKIQEIRMRTGQPVIVIHNGMETVLAEKDIGSVVSQKDIQMTLEAISSYSLYAFEDEIRQGFLTIQGGHRIGVAGKVVCENGRIISIRNLSFLNMRFVHERKGCADHILPYLTDDEGRILHTLLISPPGVGKTTVLRDMIRQISNGTAYIKGETVGVVDERSELAGSWMGVPQNDMGMRTDILDCCPKAEGMMMLLRSMSPKVIAVDELGGRKDIDAVEQALFSGCRILATVHSASLEELKQKPQWQQMIEHKIFDRYVVLSKGNEGDHLAMIFDREGQVKRCGIRF